MFIKNSLDFSLGVTKTLVFRALALAPGIAASIFDAQLVIKTSYIGLGALSVLQGLLGLKREVCKAIQTKTLIISTSNWKALVKDVGDVAIGTLMIARPFTTHPIIELSMGAYGVMNGLYCIYEGGKSLQKTQVFFQNEPRQVKWEQVGVAVTTLSLGIFSLQTNVSFLENTYEKHKTLINLKEHLPQAKYFSVYRFLSIPPNSCAKSSSQSICQELNNSYSKESSETYSLLADIYRFEDADSQRLFENLGEFSSSHQVLSLFEQIKNNEASPNINEQLKIVLHTLYEVIQQGQYTRHEYQLLDNWKLMISDFAEMHKNFNQLYSGINHSNVFEFVKCHSEPLCQTTQKIIAREPSLISKIHHLGRKLGRKTAWFENMNSFFQHTLSGYKNSGTSVTPIIDQVNLLIPYSKCYRLSLIEEIVKSIGDIQDLTSDRCYSTSEITIAKKHNALNLLSKGVSELPVVIIEPRADKNEGFTFFDRGVQNIYRFHKKVYATFVGTIDEMCCALKDAHYLHKGVSQVVLINGHGNSQHLSFGNTTFYANPKNKHYSLTPETILPKECLENNIGTDATIILRSCHTGADTSVRKPNLARWLAEKLPGRTIIAPKEIIFAGNFNYHLDSGKPNASFALKGRDITTEVKISTSKIYRSISVIKNYLASTLQSFWDLCTN